MCIEVCRRSVHPKKGNDKGKICLLKACERVDIHDDMTTKGIRKSSIIMPHRCSPHVPSRIPGYCALERKHKRNASPVRHRHAPRQANSKQTNRGTNTPSVSQGSSAWLTHRKDKGNPFTLSLLVIDWLPSCAATTMGFGEKAAPRPYSSCPPGDGASTRPSSPSSEAPRS